MSPDLASLTAATTQQTPITDIGIGIEDLWGPPKPPEDYSDAEVRETGGFRNLRAVFPRGKSDEAVLQIAREALDARWKETKSKQQLDLARGFMNSLRDLGVAIDGPGQIVLTVGAKGEVGTVEVRVAPATRERWSDETYAKHAGEYSKTVQKARNAEARGTYTLRIGPGRTSAEKVLIELIEPSKRVLVYPPSDPKNPVTGPERAEVTSISQLLRSSLNRTTLSLHEFFGLGERKPATGDEVGTR